MARDPRYFKFLGESRGKGSRQCGLVLDGTVGSQVTEESKECKRKNYHYDCEIIVS
jgi:hypothetical protein